MIFSQVGSRSSSCRQREIESPEDDAIYQENAENSFSVEVPGHLRVYGKEPK